MRALSSIELGPKAQQPENPALSWLCAFCTKLRIYEGGRPDIAIHCVWCALCDSLVVVDAKGEEVIAKLIDRHLA